MISLYLNAVKNYPLISAMVQFAILGTIGDCIARKLVGKSIEAFKIPLKMIEWAILGLTIKYCFRGFDGFLQIWMKDGMIPNLEAGSIEYAFAKSVVTNLQYGFFIVIAHRLLDNIIDRVNNWQNLPKAFLTLVWFWIPAHTLTFSLSKPFQIGLAALWSVVIGFILGMCNRKPADKISGK